MFGPGVSQLWRVFVFVIDLYELIVELYDGKIMPYSISPLEELAKFC